MTTIFYFDIHYAIKLHDWIIEKSEGFPGVNNLGLLESALDHIQNDCYYPEIVRIQVLETQSQQGFQNRGEF
ncbi:hypothetical protein [Spirulina major]|uniref:hypothetical protein n=1 Tax=Spirulina major TaxID=270636 RepID=UPI0009355EB1|nr:hypothetical protein [Spirulina major]